MTIDKIRPVLFLALFNLFSLIALGYAAEPEMRTLDGTITDIEWVGSALTVKWTNPQDSMDRETTFQVRQGTKIFRGGQSIDLSDLYRGDSVMLTYNIDPTNGDMDLLRVEALLPA